MRARTLSRLSDAVLLRELAALVARDRVTTAALLAHLAEVDARRLYLPAAHPSMHAYCVRELHMSEDAAYKRIQAARAARRFPLLLTAVEDGRLHLAAVCLLAPHLTADNVEDLVAAATHRRKFEIEALLAERFLRPQLPQAATRAAVGDAPQASAQLAPGQVAAAPSAPDPGREPETEATAAQALTPAAPAAAERVLVSLALARGTYEKLRYAQALLSHAVPSGSIEQVIDRALDALIIQLEKRKFAATQQPRSRTRPPRGAGPSARTVPAHVRRAVWDRDRGQCTFIGASGRRCESRRWLEFDHVQPVALGGRATVEGIRLRCRAHNQYEAERVFGAEFMRGKRARRRHAGTAGDVWNGLRALGVQAEDARRGSEHAAGLGTATLEERLRAALQFLGRRSMAMGMAGPAPAPIPVASGP
jgi:5-methylcytosine-specific restriction endonuclease McrA